MRIKKIANYLFVILTCTLSATKSFASDKDVGSESEVDSAAIAQMVADQERYEREKLVSSTKENNHPGWQTVRNQSGLEIPIYAEVVGNNLIGPTMLVLHGSGGTSGHHWEWAKRLNSWGYHTVLVESFKPRGLTSIVETQSIKPHHRVEDVNAVASWVAKQKWSNGQIGMIGFSHGANTVFETAKASNVSLKVGVAYYPFCYSWFNTVTIPVQLHLATEDNWTPVESCAFLYKGASRSSMVTAYEYPNSHHGFDLLRNLVIQFPAMTISGMKTVTYGSNRQQGEVSFERVKKFLLEKLPVERN